MPHLQDLKYTGFRGLPAISDGAMQDMELAELRDFHSPIISGTIGDEYRKLFRDDPSVTQLQYNDGLRQWLASKGHTQPQIKEREFSYYTSIQPP